MKLTSNAYDNIVIDVFEGVKADQVLQDFDPQTVH